MSHDAPRPLVPLSPAMRRALVKELIRRRMQQVQDLARAQAQAARKEMERRDREGAAWLVDQWKEGKL